MKKKLLYIWKSPYPWDVRVEKICRSFVDSNFDVYILARWGGESLQKENIDGFNVIRVGFNQKSIFSLPVPLNPIWKKAIKHAIHEIKPDLVIVREIMLAEDTGKIAGKYKIPVLMDMAENYPSALKAWKKYNSNFISRYIIHSMKVPELVEKRAVAKMDGIITVCEEQNSRLFSTYNFAHDKMVIVHNTPTLNYFPEPAQKCFGPELVIGHHGYHTSEKSILNFLKAFVELGDQISGFTLKIAGSGDDIPEFKKIAENTCNIEFLGEYAHKDLYNIISEFQIGILPYQINDFNNYTIHNKVFDYFALRIPVIVSEAVPLKRLVEETQSGLAVDCENTESIKSVLLKLRDYDWEKYSENAYLAFKSKYNWENDAKTLLNFTKQFI